MKYNREIFLAASVVLVLFLIHSCKKDGLLPKNPYDAILRDDTTRQEIPLDSLTITYVHNKVLASRCALPGCHVGNFEPDFRTPQSSFSSLVYAPISKNNAAKTFFYRVIPFDTAKSVLHERITKCCFVNNNDRMPQDTIGVPLPDSSINLITQWIMHGARDMFGKVAKLPNAEPVIEGYAAANTSLTKYYSVEVKDRLDSVYYNPFIIPDSVASFYVAFQLSDDSTPVSQLKKNTLKISTDADNFSSGWSYTATYFTLGLQSAWLVTVPASSLPMNDTLFMRYYVNDGSRPNDTEYPRNETLFPYKSYWSFIRK
ncbi:MAG: hypothetical protein IPP77_12070 [Bacteroidetes bacterium]|nr:hypothetical protein [Bacteroidota bacterium]